MPIHRGYDKKGCYYQWGSQKNIIINAVIKTVVKRQK